MSDSIEVEISGLEELQGQFEQIAEAFDPDKVQKASLQSAEVIRAESERNAPRGPTGQLKEAQVKKPLKVSENVASAIAAVDRVKAPHAYWVEYGNSRMPAQKYFRRAVASKGDEAAEIFYSALESMVDEAVR